MAENNKLLVSILIISETASKDPSTDKCVPALKDTIAKLDKKSQWEIGNVRIVPDDVLAIQRAVMQDVGARMNLIVTSGGTGFATKDVTPEVRSRSAIQWTAKHTRHFRYTISSKTLHGVSYEVEDELNAKC